jgi:hypothetical protein
MFTRVMRRPPVPRRPQELSKEATAKAKASVSASAKVLSESSFETCSGCVARKMCKKSSCCMYGQSKPKENKNAKNG